MQLSLDLRILRLDMSVRAVHILAGGLVAALIVVAANLPRLVRPAPPPLPAEPAPPPTRA